MSDREEIKDVTGRTLKFITFGLGREKFGIAIEDVKEIIASYNIVPLPRTPEFIEGIISLRGDIIPVVDMRARFDMPAREDDEDTRVIVLEMPDFSVGIQVDNVYEVLKLNENNVEPPPRLVGGLKGDYIDGVAEINGKLTIILNLDEIFSSAEKIAMQGSIENAEVKSGESVDIRPAEPAPSEKDKESHTSMVSAAGQVEIRGKSYYLGKKYSGKEVVVREKGGVISFHLGGEKIKEFSD